MSNTMRIAPAGARSNERPSRSAAGRHDPDHLRGVALIRAREAHERHLVDGISDALLQVNRELTVQDIVHWWREMGVLWVDDRDASRRARARLEERVARGELAREVKIDAKRNYAFVHYRRASA